MHSAIFSREQLAKDYVNQFNKNLSLELDTWIETQLKQTILQPKLEILDDQIRKELQAIKSDRFIINKQINTKSPNWVFYGAGENGFAGYVLAAIGVLYNTRLLESAIINILSLDSKIRAKSFESGWQQFVDSREVTFEKINEIIGSAFHERVALADEVIGDVLSIYENILQQQEQANQETLEALEEEKIKITQKRQELEQAQKRIEAILNQSVE